MIGLFTFPHFRSAGRPERMGHNTCKSMEQVLCVVRRCDWLALLLKIMWAAIADDCVHISWRGRGGWGIHLCRHLETRLPSVSCWNRLHSALCIHIIALFICCILLHWHCICVGYIALHCIALHCIALHCIALHCIALHCIALHCIALLCFALHCIALHYIASHRIALLCFALHCIALHCIALHCIALHCIALHCIALHCIALYCIALHCDVICYSRLALPPMCEFCQKTISVYL